MAYGMLETQLAAHEFLAGDTFTIADCAAAPGLFYALAIHPWDERATRELTRYYRAFAQRPSFAKVIANARPYRDAVPAAVAGRLRPLPLMGRFPLMSDTTCHMSISLDGFVAGPDQSREHPLGKRGIELHGWHLGDERATEADATATGWLMRPRGAYVMGRNMFGPIRGEWDEDWRGWWGPEPPYHAPVFVLTHHATSRSRWRAGRRSTSSPTASTPRTPQARETAGDNGIDIAGGASTVRQALSAGVIDELSLDIAPVLLGSGERIFDGVETFGFVPVEVLHSPLATHIRYRR